MGIGIKELLVILVILVIIVVLFGTGRLKNMGADLASAVKGFKKAMNDEKDAAAPAAVEGIVDASTSGAAAAEKIVEKAD